MRADDDTWDPATGVGATATMTAAGRARLSRADHPPFVDPFAELLVQAVGIDLFTRWARGDLDAAEVDIPGHSWGLQPMTDAQAVRTPLIDAFLADAVGSGIRQAVIVASGLDTRGYRLSWPAGMTVFEVDQAQVLAFKSATLAALGVEPRVDLRTVAADLRHDWTPSLRHAGFAPDRSTAWVAEGLLGYLPPAAQDRLLDDITALSGAGSRLLVDVFWTNPKTQQIVQAAARKWQAYGLDVELGELCYPRERNDVSAHLDQHGWRLIVCTQLSQLLSAAGLPAPAGPQTDNYYYTATR